MWACYFRTHQVLLVNFSKGLKLDPSVFWRLRGLLFVLFVLDVVFYYLLEHWGGLLRLRGGKSNVVFGCGWAYDLAFIWVWTEGVWPLTHISMIWGVFLSLIWVLCRWDLPREVQLFLIFLVLEQHLGLSSDLRAQLFLLLMHIELIRGYRMRWFVY
jgi:hypothetical protein